MQNLEFGTVQRNYDLVDLEECCKMSIWLQKTVLIQLRTSVGKSDACDAAAVIVVETYGAAAAVPAAAAASTSSAVMRPSGPCEGTQLFQQNYQKF